MSRIVVIVLGLVALYVVASYIVSRNFTVAGGGNPLLYLLKDKLGLNTPRLEKSSATVEVRAPQNEVANVWEFSGATIYAN